MSSAPPLSSEQALDEYFDALLCEEWGDEETVPEKDSELEPELARQPIAARSSGSPMFADEDIEELPGANLEEVQRLLNQLEQTNPVEDLHLEEVMEQNTTDIAVETATIEETMVEEQVIEPVVEEIQEWDVTTLTEEDEGEPHHHVDAVEEEEVATENFIEEPQTDTDIDVDVDVAVASTTEQEVEQQVDTAPQTQTGGLNPENWKDPIRSEAFQVLYFDVNGVTFAVPLEELGGIHRMGELSHLIGRPKWYLGLQAQRDAQLDVVDTAKWVMAEKLRDDSYKEAYQYIVMLGESMWGLACSQLMGTELLQSEKVRWREQVGKRPWLAGMVKEKMCALIHVEALIAMLNAGLDVKSLDN
ncbi:chemotaxis protein CheW [Vibrio sp. CAIM 722]|uniref:Chemotaxis protein CheW n=1 Tax=Vibrio eleionomae TaxID=2653505 RepID=A0A7X4LHT2_9VIBR|nr:chemotaxis protein CheW [Vibrio eleionomae]MZI92126.1 chemotaxis protein CheW [Vibrio eleionomae]